MTSPIAHGLAAVLLLSTAAFADGPALRGDVVATRDALTLGDLVDRAPAALAATPMFRAPPLGQSGTIQARRIAAAAEALGLGPVETGGRTQVTITRAARQVGATAMEAALRKVLAREHGLDGAATGISFDGPAPVLVVAPDVVGEVAASDVTFDRRSRRVGATLWIGPSPTERRAQLRVTGTAVETVEVAVVNRSLERGAAVGASDVAIERRPRDSVPSDAIYDGAPLDGRVARRPLGAGSLLRAADLIRPEIVGRGEIVTIVYEMRGVSLSLRGRASDPGALGDAIGVVNPQSKKVLQATVIGPGRVSVSTAPTGRLAAASTAKN